MPATCREDQHFERFRSRHDLSPLALALEWNVLSLAFDPPAVLPKGDFLPSSVIGVSITARPSHERELLPDSRTVTGTGQFPSLVADTRVREVQ